MQDSSKVNGPDPAVRDCVSEAIESARDLPGDPREHQRKSSVTAATRRPMKNCSKLNVGCGADIRPDHINLDIVPADGVDVVHNINLLPWPFESGSFEFIRCSHILEHVLDFHSCLMEIHRIARSDATIEVIGPYFFSTKFAGDPSHRIPFSYRTFDNYTRPRRIRFYNRWRLEYATNFGAGFPFATLDKRYIFDRNPWIRWIGFVHNLAPALYERFTPTLLPPMEVAFRLQALK